MSPEKNYVYPKAQTLNSIYKEQQYYNQEKIITPVSLDCSSTSSKIKSELSNTIISSKSPI